VSLWVQAQLLSFAEEKTDPTAERSEALKDLERELATQMLEYYEGKHQGSRISEDL
jgi:hypothetical protein